MSRTPAIVVVIVCAAMWGLWWYPVGLFEDMGLGGPWIGMVMCVTTLPVGLVWMAIRPRGLSPRAVAGCIIVGAAFMFYAVAVVYTDFIRAVLLFYLAPAWSTLIEVVFFRRRWSVQSTIAIMFSLIGVLMISRGEISFEGIGAIGDWMALVSGMCWSIGCALVFSSRRAEIAPVLVATGLGGAASAGIVALLDGSFSAGVPDFAALAVANPWPFVFSAAYVGTMMAGTMWGAFRLPPAVMTYLLSVEILGGVLSSTLLLGEVFGWLEAGGAIFILAAVLVEVVWTRPVEKSTVL